MNNPNVSQSRSHSEIDLDALNNRHESSRDKWFRMCAGASSKITSFENGIIHLKITVDERLKLTLERISRNIVESWIHEDELCHATGFVAEVFKTEGLLGFYVPIDENNPADGISEELIRRIKAVPANPDILLEVIQGTFNDESDCGITGKEGSFQIY